MAVTFTREFYINFGLFLFACVALVLSIWAFATPCKKDKFGDKSCKPIPCKGAMCGSHGIATDCTHDSLGWGQTCDLSKDKCCGFIRSSHLICQSNSSNQCPTCGFD